MSAASFEVSTAGFKMSSAGVAEGQVALEVADGFVVVLVVEVL